MPENDEIISNQICVLAAAYSRLKLPHNLYGKLSTMHCADVSFEYMSLPDGVDPINVRILSDNVKWLATLRDEEGHDKGRAMASGARILGTG